MDKRTVNKTPSDQDRVFDMNHEDRMRFTYRSGADMFLTICTDVDQEISCEMGKMIDELSIDEEAALRAEDIERLSNWLKAMTKAWRKDVIDYGNERGGDYAEYE